MNRPGKQLIADVPEEKGERNMGMQRDRGHSCPQTSGPITRPDSIVRTGSDNDRVPQNASPSTGRFFLPALYIDGNFICYSQRRSKNERSRKGPRNSETKGSSSAGA